MLINLARAMNTMREHRLDALIATSPVNVTYFSDYRCWIDALFRNHMSSPGASSERSQTYALLTADGDPALVVSALFAINAADCWARGLYLVGDAGLDDSLPPPGGLDGRNGAFYDLLHPVRPHAGTPTEALCRALADRGLSDGRLGIDMEGLGARGREDLRVHLPNARLLDCSNLIRWIRMVKSGTEISLLRRSAQINEQNAQASLALARPGVPMSTVVNHYRAGIAASGADFDHFAYSPGGHGLATEPEYVLQLGDVMYTDFGCLYRGYFSDAGVTLALGDLSPQLWRRYRRLYDCIEAAVAAIRPGVQSSAVQAAMWTAFAADGLTASAPHGHGYGLEVRDYPILVSANGLRIRDDCLDVDSDLPLEAGMVLSLEAGLFASGVASLQIERSVLVTSGGSEPLVHQDRTRPVQPALTDVKGAGT